MYRLLVFASVGSVLLSCGVQHTGISKARAVKAAKAYVVRVDYRGNEPLFYRNTGNRPTVVLQTTDASGQRSWFIRFDDLQAMHEHCVHVRGSSTRVIARAANC